MHSSSRCDRAEPRRLHVQPARRDGERVDVGQRVDRRVEAQPLLGAAQRLAGLALEPRVLDHRIRERRSRSRGRSPGRRASRRRCRGSRPSGRARARGRWRPARAIIAASHAGLGVELELERRVGRDPAVDVAAGRDDEAHRPGLAPDRPARARARPGAGRGRARRSRTPTGGSRARRASRARGVQRLEAVEPRARSARSVRTPASGKAGREVVVVVGRVGDVLAAALVPAAVQDHGGRHAREARRDVDGPALDRRSRRRSAPRSASAS